MTDDNDDNAGGDEDTSWKKTNNTPIPDAGLDAKVTSFFRKLEHMAAARPPRAEADSHGAGGIRPSSELLRALGFVGEHHRIDIYLSPRKEIQSKTVTETEMTLHVTYQHSLGREAGITTIRATVLVVNQKLRARSLDKSMDG